jgi:hypothetical protein
LYQSERAAANSDGSWRETVPVLGTTHIIVTAPVDYHEMFEGPKLVYPDILWSAQFSATPAGFYVNNTSYLIPANDPWLVASLNSPALWSYLWRTAQHAKDEALRMFGEYVLQLPIPIATPDQVEAATMAVDSITRLTREARDAELAVLDLLRVEYGVGTTGRMLDDFSTLGSDAFVREVVKRRPKSAGRLTAAGLKELRAFYDAEAPAVVGKRAHILTLEREIAKAVHAAWGLTDADLSLLRQTAPPRMPPGW